MKKHFENYKYLVLLLLLDEVTTVAVSFIHAVIHSASKHVSSGSSSWLSLLWLHEFGQITFESERL